MPQPKDRAYIEVSFDLLHQLLHLSPAIGIQTVTTSQITESIKIYVSGTQVAPATRRGEAMRVPLLDAIDQSIRREIDS